MPLEGEGGGGSLRGLWVGPALGTLVALTDSPSTCLQIASSCHVSPRVGRTSLCEVTVPGPGGVASASGPGCVWRGVEGGQGAVWSHGSL